LSANPEMSASIRVILVNFNAGETISRSIQSALDSGETVQITLYDNASSDGSVELTRRVFAGVDSLDIVEGSENIGFARAVNAAAKSCQEDYLLVLNPDCELFPGALSGMKRALENDPGAALAGPLVVNRQGAVQRGTLRYFPDPWRSFVTFSGLWRLEQWFPAFGGVERSQQEIGGDHLSAEAVTGACMLIRRSVFEQLGGLDEGYGLHCEDLDFMYRLHQAGYRCLLIPGAKVFHQQGVSSRSRPAWVHLQKHLGMQRFFYKFQADHHSLPFRWLVTAGIWSRYALTLPAALLRK
jgi:GT2 family glycosyltransferase